MFSGIGHVECLPMWIRIKIEESTQFDGVDLLKQTELLDQVSESKLTD